MGLLQRQIHKREPYHANTQGIPILLEVHLIESHGVVPARYGAPEGTDRNAWMWEQHCAKHNHPVDPAERGAFVSHADAIERAGRGVFSA